LTKTAIWFLTMNGFTPHPLCFLARDSAMCLEIWSTIALTCVPPFTVAMALTNETWWNWPSDGATTTSHRSPSLTAALGVSAGRHRRT